MSIHREFRSSFGLPYNDVFEITVLPPTNIRVVRTQTTGGQLTYRYTVTWEHSVDGQPGIYRLDFNYTVNDITDNRIIEVEGHLQEAQVSFDIHTTINFIEIESIKYNRASEVIRILYSDFVI